MPHLTLSLLGSFQATLDGRPLANFGYDKVYALLAYLAVEADRPHHRTALAALLWPDQDEELARQSLRQALYRLHRVLGETEPGNPFLIVDRNTIRFNHASSHTLDVTAFTASLTCRSDNPAIRTDCRRYHNRIAALYRGPFLEHLSLPHSPGFEEWVRLKREYFRQQALTILHRLAVCHEQSGEYTEALSHARHQLELEPWHEEAHRQVIRLLALMNQHEAALAHYETCRCILAAELGIAPAEETTRLYQRIRNRQVGTLRCDPARETEPTRDHAAAKPFPGFLHFTGERRQITALYCTSKSVLELDPEELCLALTDYYQLCVSIIRGFDGHVVQQYDGGLLVLFGYPAAHEDAARRAVQTALALVNQMPSRQDLRIGIHTGPVVVPHAATAHDLEFPAIVGSIPRIASQLHDLATSNAVVISDVTYRLVQAYFQCARLGEYPIQDPSAPLVAYCVEHERDLPNQGQTTFGGQPPPIIGREREMDFLLDHWRRAAQGEGNCILLTGEPGIGKSRLIRALRERLAPETLVWRECHCGPRFQDSALHPIITLIERLLQLHRGDSPQIRLDKLEAYLARYPITVPEAAPLLADLLGLWQANRYPPLNLPPQVLKAKKQQILLSLLRFLAIRQPVVFVVEDLHWADPSTLELLGMLIRQASLLPVLAILTARPEFDPPWPAGATPAVLRLDPLAPHAAGTLVRQLAQGQPLPSHMIKEVVERSDGVPLFVEELTGMLLDSHSTETVQQLEKERMPSRVPRTLHDLLAARLDRLGPSSKAVAQLGATLGREFSEELLLRVAALDESRESDGAKLIQKLNQLIEAGVLVRSETASGTVYQFRHTLIQETAYHSQLKRHRQTTHARVAAILLRQFPQSAETQPELLAWHLTEAGNLREAIGYWLRAGQKAIKQSANLEAIAHLNHGLALIHALPSGLERARFELDLRVALGASLAAVKGYGATETVQAYTRASALCRQAREDKKLFAILWGLWLGASTRSGYVEARDLADRLLAIARQEQDPIYLLGAHYAMGNTLFWLGDFTRALSHSEQVGAYYDPCRNEEIILLYGENPAATSLAFAGWALWFLGFPDQALRKMDQATNLAGTLAHPHSLAFVLTFAAMLHRFRREPKSTLAMADTIITLAEEHEFALWLAAGTALRGWALAAQGRDEGVLHVAQSLEGMRQAMSGVGVTFLSLLVEAHGHAGQPEAGLAVLAEALATVKQTGDCYYESELYRLKGELLLQIDHAANEGQGAACFTKAIKRSREQSAKSLELRATLSLCRLRQRQDGQAMALRNLAKVYQGLAEGFGTADLREAGALLGAQTE